MWINEKLSFQVARPMATIQFEQGQEGHLCLAARWPASKPEKEPCSLHPGLEHQSNPLSLSPIQQYTHVRTVHELSHSIKCLILFLQLI